MTGSAPRVLVIEDEPQMRRVLRATLRAHGYAIVEAVTAHEGIALAAEQPPDVVLLDLGLPDHDGIDVTRRIRQWSEVPILVLSVRGREQDKVQALDAGADDYVTKPFGTQELLARMRVAARRGARSASSTAGDARIALGPVVIDPVRRVVLRRDVEVHLTPIEYRLLLLLARHAGRVLTHAQILREIWGPGHVTQTEYLRVYMLQLRRKLEDDPARPRLIVTEPGVGYRGRDDAGP